MNPVAKSSVPCPSARRMRSVSMLGQHRLASGLQSVVPGMNEKNRKASGGKVGVCVDR